MAQQEKQLLVSLDIGTSKIVTLVAEVHPDKQVHVIGMGMAPSRGLKWGVVVDIEATVQSIQESVAEAERASGYKINSTFAGIAGTHINSINSHGIVAVRSGEINAQDVERVIEAAKAIPLPNDQKILHVLPQDFIIDNQPGIREPVGMSGVRLEVRVHMISGSISAAQNIIKCVQRCGLTPTDIILEQLASSYAVLSPDEKELGICLVDIGGGTTDIAVFTNGAIRHSGVIPIAGDQVTQDLAIALRLSTKQAEQIKLKHAHTFSDQASETIHIALHDAEQQFKHNPQHILTEKRLAEYIQPRYEEILDLINEQLEHIGLKSFLGAGVVFTGGAALAKGLTELSQKTLNLPCRIGTPQEVYGLGETLNNPMYATSVGLLRYGYQQHYERTAEHDHRSLKNAWTKVKNWFYEHL